MKEFDVVIIGAGIVGSATAWQLIEQYPRKKILLIDKEPLPALHQTGRNSGVIHAGVYYPAGSLKARFCKQGLVETITFCQQYKLPYQQCGKLLVATDDAEMDTMDTLFARSQENQLSVKMLNQQQLKQQEPNIRGVAAMLLKDTGITDYRAITGTMLALFNAAGGQVIYEQQVLALHEDDTGVCVETQNARYKTKILLNCAGLHADRIIKLLKVPIDFQIVPFRGEYFKLPAKYKALVNHLIYPIPNPALPFLGVHLTPMIDGSITVGPNAVLALAREAYDRGEYRVADLCELMKFKGTLPLFRQHARFGLGEMKNSWFKRGYLKQVQKYCPEIQLSDLRPHPSGIRAQAVSQSGELIHDFKFVETPHSLHVGNAPSPAATSAIPIAKHIVASLVEKMA
ncbi:MAG: L-2-hydroxyglutarate oxidase [Paraglaciecola sp.]